MFSLHCSWKSPVAFRLFLSVTIKMCFNCSTVVADTEGCYHSDIDHTELGIFSSLIWQAADLLYTVATDVLVLLCPDGELGISSSGLYISQQLLHCTYV